ncbi:MAG: hypothetical protein ACI86M_000484 [Saprospiraceae bacterium]|jgi:hypothetical protein
MCDYIFISKGNRLEEKNPLTYFIIISKLPQKTFIQNIIVKNTKRFDVIIKNIVT